MWPWVSNTFLKVLVLAIKLSLGLSGISSYGWNVRMSEKHLHHQTRGSTHSAIRAHRRRGYLGPNPSYEAQECLSETYTLDMFLSQPTNQRRRWHPTPALLPGKSHGRRSLVGCSPGGCRVRHDWATSLSLFIFMHWRRKWQPTPVFLPGESQGRASLVGCRLWGCTESDTTEAT